MKARERTKVITPDGFDPIKVKEKARAEAIARKKKKAIRLAEETKILEKAIMQPEPKVEVEPSPYATMSKTELWSEVKQLRETDEDAMPDIKYRSVVSDMRTALETYTPPVIEEMEIGEEDVGAVEDVLE